MLLCKSLLITKYTGHVSPKSWSFLGTLTGTKRLRALFPTLSCASWVSLSWTSHISLALFSKMGIAEYFLWVYLPLETKSASVQSLPPLSRDRGKYNCSNSHTKFLVLPWDTFSTATFHLSSFPNQPIHLWFFMRFPSSHSLVGESGRYMSHRDRTIFFQDGENVSWASSFAVAW